MLLTVINIFISIVKHLTIMSVSSNKAPIQKMPHSQSNKSLYTENSQDSDNQPNELPPSRNVIGSKAEPRKIERSPRHKEELDDVPELPQQYQNKPTNNFPQNGPVMPLGFHGYSNQPRQMTPNHNTIAVSKPTT